MRLSIKSSVRNPPRGVLSDSTAGIPDSCYGDVLSITGKGTVRGSDRLVLADGDWCAYASSDTGVSDYTAEHAKQNVLSCSCLAARL